MMRQIDNRVLVARRGEIQPQPVVTRQRIDRQDAQVAGETLLAVRAEITQFHRRAVRRQQRLGLPNRLVKSPQSAVQRVGGIIDGEFVGDAVERELPFGDAVAATPDQAAKIGRRREITFQVVIPEHHVAQPAPPVGDQPGSDDAAVIGEADFHPVAIAQGVKICGLAVASRPEGSAVNFASRWIHGADTARPARQNPARKR